MSCRRAWSLVLLSSVLLHACGGGSDEEKRPSPFPLSEQAAVPEGVPDPLPFESAYVSPPCIGEEPPEQMEVQQMPAGGEGFVRSTGPFGIGETVGVCFNALREELPVEVTITGAGGTSLRRRFPAGQQRNERWWTVVVGPDWAPGSYTVVARQQQEQQTAEFEVEASPAAPINSSARFGIVAGEKLDLVVAQQRANTRVPVDVYVQQESRYRFRTTLEVATNDAGAGSRTVPTTARDAYNYVFAVRGSDGALTEATVSAPVTGEPVTLPKGVRPRSVFQAHDAPPEGVAKQIAYYQEGGPSSCDPALGSEPELVFRRDEPRAWRERDRAEQERPEVGDFLATCFYNFVADEPLTLITTSPSGRRVEEEILGELVNTDIGHATLMTPDLELGEYRVSARQGDLEAESSYRLVEASAPGYRVETLGSRHVVLVVGLPSRQEAQLLVYRTPDRGPRDPMRPFVLRAGYVTNIPVRADNRGIIDHELRPDPSDRGCYVIKVTYDEYVLDDQSNTLSLACFGRG